MVAAGQRDSIPTIVIKHNYIDTAALLQRDGNSFHLPVLVTDYPVKIDPALDTIAIIYLWCDTAAGRKIFPYVDLAYWSFGYEVREQRLSQNLWSANGMPVRDFYYTHKEYLDRNRRPLGKNIIVWQTFKLK